MLARIVGIVLGLALGALSYAILHPRGLEGRIPPIPLGAFQPQSTAFAAAAAAFGLVIFIAALMPKGPGGSDGGGKRKRDRPPVTVDFTAGPAFESPAFESATEGRMEMMAEGAWCERPAPALQRTLDQDIAAQALAEALAPSPQVPGAPPGASAFAEARLALHAQAHSETWSEAAATLRRLSSLAGDDHERLLAAQDTGDFARAQGQVDDAADAYDEALAYARMLGDDEVLAGCLINKGDMAYEAHRLDEAGQAYDEALGLRRRLAEDAPWNAAGRRALSLTLERLADLREDRGHRSRALDLYRESLDIAGSLAVADPARYGPDLDVTRRRLAELEAKIQA
jgi:tetratricopeptide (TPR) repeat protein